MGLQAIRQPEMSSALVPNESEPTQGHDVLSTLGLALPLTLSVVLFELPDPPPHSAHPNPNLDARAVVEVQLIALSRNHEPHFDAGVETAYRFLSTSLKNRLGGFRGVSQAFYGPALRPLLGHRRAFVAPLGDSGSRAEFQVDILQTDGRGRARFRFELRRTSADGEASCWLVSAIRPLDRKRTSPTSPGGAPKPPVRI